MANKIKLDIQSLLPGVVDSQDACVQRLSDLLIAKLGIDSVHVVAADAEDAKRLCIHFDPDRVSISEVCELANRVGASLHQRYGHWQQRIDARHASRASTIESRLRRIAGVLEVVVSPDGAVRVEFDRGQVDEQSLARALQEWTKTSPSPALQTDSKVTSTQQAGEKHGHEGHDHGNETSDHEEHSHGGIFGANTELIFAGLSGVFLVVGWVLKTFGELPPWIPLACFATAYFFGGYFTVLEAFEKIRNKVFEIDFLMIVAAVGAACLGEWADGALLQFLFSIGHALERFAMGRARRAIEALAELAPQTASVRRDGNVTELSVNDLVVGDVVVVKPNERISADGFVVKGTSSVNQAPITGESIPVDKEPVDDVAAASLKPQELSPKNRVFAGTINSNGALEIQVTKLASENTLSRVVELVNSAETRISPTQQFTNKFERYFVPIVLGFIVLLLFAWVVVDEPFSASFYRAMSVVVAASPCALAIATPSAVLCGIARAARGGVLIKGAEARWRPQSCAMGRASWKRVGAVRRYRRLPN